MSDFLGFVECAGCGELFPVRSKLGMNRAKWCSGRCRKASYGDPCVDCGARTSSGAESARIAEPRCSNCSYARRLVWSRELVIARVQEWAEIHGEPPAMPDWNPNMARRINNEARAERFEQADGHWPWFTQVVARFGSWNAGIEAAGFTPRITGGGGANVSRRRSMRAKAAA